MIDIEIPQRAPRNLLGEGFELNSWEELKPFFEELVQRKIHSPEDFKSWLLHRSEIESYLSENMAWRYIKMTCDTTSNEFQKAYQFFVTEIQPHLAAYNDLLNKKVLRNPYLDQIDLPGIEITRRNIQKAVEIFRESNIEISTKIQTKQAEYQSITGAMTVTLDGEEQTLQKAGMRLQSTNREKRKEAWLAIAERRLEDAETLDHLFNELRDLRHKMAVNADFKNFRDYMFAAMGRFDYTPEDCFNFHSAIKEAVVPLVNQTVSERKNKLKLTRLKPWDKSVDVLGRNALKPFKNGSDLLDKAILCFDNISRDLGDYLRIMRRMGHFDVESRKGKAPGGYNYPLEEIGVPFIFMNATGSVRDLVTMVHEGGHAIHSFETRNLPINTFRNPTMEVAEVASMAMELISMEHWDVFFANKEDLKRAKIEHLEDILATLPWIATVDKFQHWIYENPSHSVKERNSEWLQIMEEFSDSYTDWEGLERFKRYTWHKQLHIFEVPFYYIEYGIAQLGAISVWRNYKNHPTNGLNSYLNGLRIGNTATIGEIYQAMGIRFDFSKEYISELMFFVQSELLSLKTK